LPANEKIKNLIVYDFSGRILLKKGLYIENQDDGIIQMNISDWPDGIYTIVFSDDSGAQYMSSRFVKVGH
jgi:hypothetical protein